MKKIFAITALFLGYYSFAQQEVKLDITDALALRTLDFSYEYYLSEKSSVGIAALFNFEGRNSDFRYNEDRMITPYFRHLFTTDRTWNFFGEIFLGINTGEKEIITNNVTTYRDYTDGALGIGVGSKYLSESGFIVDIHAGLGRNLFGSDSPAVVPRIGLNVGYRF